tara:strand:- start:1662 stop:2612 length:951 start_codon:yes stop_codon:yes gene_type:complete
MKKISLIGAGNIGGTLASIIAEKNLCDEIFLVDIAEGLAQGKALDLSQGSAINGSSTKYFGTSDLSHIDNSEVIIVTAGIARRPGMTRDDLIEINLKVMKDVGFAIKNYSPKAFVICVTNPLDAMVWTLKKVSGLKKQMIVGMAGTLDSSRFRFFLSETLQISEKYIQTMVLGGHGDTMVPLLKYTTVSGIPLLELITKNLISKAKVDEIVQRTRNGGGEIVKLLKNSSAFYAPAISTVEIAESFLKNEKKLIPCSSYLEGEYNVKDLFVGVPVIIGKNGVERIVELDFDIEEKNNFNFSVKSVEELTKKCKKLLE